MGCGPEAGGKGERKMKIVVISPLKVFIAGAIASLLIMGSVLGALALWGVIRSDPAEAYGVDGVGSKDWYFAEGYTGPGFEEWILLYNPPADRGGSGSGVDVELLFYGSSGYIGGAFVSVASGQRVSVNINDLLLSGFGYSGDVSIVAHNGAFPFVAERALYFDYKGQWTGGNQSLGYNEGAAE
jgi:hypothetical protein